MLSDDQNIREDSEPNTPPRVAGTTPKEKSMPTKTIADTARLTALLDEALVLADTLQLPIAAIHIDQARAQLGDATDA